MKKIHKTLTLLSVSLFASSALGFDPRPFQLDELQTAAQVGIAHHLEENNISASEVTGYAVGRDGKEAKLRIFFTDKAKNATLHCHFHRGNRSEIDCH